jgi:hypothetical protein
MAGFRLAGPVCRVLAALEIDAGTMCLAPSPTPGTIMHHRKLAHVPKLGLATSGLTEADFVMAAAVLGTGVSPVLVLAFAEVESGGTSGFGPSGLPIIAYEGHIFRKYTHKQFDEEHPLLSYKYVKKAGPEWHHNNKDQATAWETLNEAMALHHDAALMACSWGMFQLMGFNYEACGYESVDDFIVAMKASAKGQLLAFVGFCKKQSGMVAAMQDKNFAGMAAIYNGQDFGDYDNRIVRAYKKHGGH